MKKILLTIILSLLLTSCNNPFSAGTLTWTAINVNAYIQQGDAHLISKNGKHILIDVGHRSYAKKILIPTLQKAGVKSIDKVLITHPHNDHYGGLKPLIDAGMKIKAIYMNMPTKKQMAQEPWGGSYAELDEIQLLAKKADIPVVPIVMGDKYTFDSDTYIEVLYVYNGINTPVGKTDLNDMSAVCMVYHGENRFLLTGDLNKKLGGYLAKNVDNLRADILKSPHHGTEHFAPNAFFDKVEAKVLIVPAPKHIWWSENSKRTRNLARQKGYETYVNGFHGNITVTSDGTRYTIKTDREITGILSK
ncbi:MAG: Metallo-beta-lactamase family protein [uncultured Sulfurovum sp.]|uniref:Metallo-beta-lactamase family protein n=1 Tax=uncultured Sulfurovum sp. TaxID=269237 RepID=A0A6S6U968_9BACT|nr:MAG: Metallo-beta-lactamase family protein [uncultured Sulfurovum sp.]